MMFTFKICLSIALAFLMHKFELADAIIFGADAKYGEFPFAVSLRNETREHYCGGALITKRHILTAGHCLYTDRTVFYNKPAELYNASVINVVVDTISSNQSQGEFYQAAKLIPHPSYNVSNLTSMFHDIGIIELTHNITNENVKLIGLPCRHVNYGTLTTVAGWGVNSKEYIESRAKIAPVLQKANMIVMKPEKCLDAYLDRMSKFDITAQALFNRAAFCGSHDRANVCYRDSGSPMIQDDLIVGIVIMGVCKEEYSDIFTDVSYYKDFILNTTTNFSPIDVACSGASNFLESQGLGVGGQLRDFIFKKTILLIFSFMLIFKP